MNEVVSSRLRLWPAETVVLEEVRDVVSEVKLTGRFATWLSLVLELIVMVEVAWSAGTCWMLDWKDSCVKL